MRVRSRKGGYSAEIANSYIDESQPIQLLSTELEPQMRFENGKPTKDVAAYKAWFTQQGVGPFQVKFGTKVKLPNYLAFVNFQNLEACEVSYNVYFRASGLKEVK